MTADDAWGGQVDGARTRDLEGIAAPADPVALSYWPGVLDGLSVDVEALRTGLEGALTALGAAGGKRDLEALALVAEVQAARRVLGEVEAIATRWLGLSATIPKTGVLPDGSTYEVKRGQNRKAWAHDSWKHDVRAAVLKRLGVTGNDLVDPASGEMVDVHGMLTWVQEVAGTTGPRLGNLRALGLEPDDYCEVFPGLWGVQVTPPEPAPESTP